MAGLSQIQGQNLVEDREERKGERNWTRSKMGFRNVRIFKLSEWVKEPKRDYWRGTKATTKCHENGSVCDIFPPKDENIT